MCLLSIFVTSIWKPLSANILNIHIGRYFNILIFWLPDIVIGIAYKISYRVQVSRVQVFKIHVEQLTEEIKMDFRIRRLNLFNQIKNAL